jgi:hypothetical protein
MSVSKPKHKKKSRLWYAFKLFVRVTVGGALILATLLAVAFSYVSRPEVLAQLVRNAIATKLNAPVSIGAISLTLDGTIVIDDVAITVDPGEDFFKSISATQAAAIAGTQPVPLPPGNDEPGSTQPDSSLDTRASGLLRIRRITIRENPYKLVTSGTIDVQSIVISRPTIYVIENLDTRQYNIQTLKFKPGSITGSAAGVPTPSAPTTLPPVTLEGARVFTGVVEKGVYRPVGLMRLRGELRPHTSAPGTYEFEVDQFKDIENDKSKNVQIKGYFSPEKLAIAGSVRGFSLKSSIAEFLPEEYRRSWDQFKPEGELNLLTFNYSPSSGVGTSIGLVNGAITLELDKIVKRMEEVDLKINFEKDKLTVDHLRGRIGNVTYECAGVLKGLSRTAPFELKVQVNPFVIPEKPEELSKYPAVVQKYHQRLKPSGTYSATLSMERKAIGAPIDYTGAVQISNAKITYADFAYPIQNVYGKISFSNTQVLIEKLTGRGPTGAHLEIDGYIRPPGDGAEVELNVVGTHIPLDDSLRRAFGPQTLGIYDMIRDRGLYASYVKDKIIPLGPDGKSVFTLDGIVAMKTKVRRELGDDSEYHTIVSIDAKGAKILFKYWPYPVEATAGTIIVAPPIVTLDKVTFKSPTGATGVISGTVSGGTGPTDPLKPNLQLTVDNMPIEPMFLASLPPDYSEFIQSMAITGTVGVNGRVFYNPNIKGIDFALDTTVKNGSADPNHSGYKLDTFEGEAIVSTNGVEFKEIRGTHNKTRFSLIGEAQIIDKKQKSRMYLEFFDLNLSEPFWQLVPKSSNVGQNIKDSLERFQLKGEVEGRMYYQTIRPEEPPFSGRIEPKSLSLVYAGDPIQLTKMSGALDFDLDQIHFDRLGMVIGFTEAEVRGSASVKNIGDFDLRIDARGPNLLAPTSYLIPKGLRGAIDGIELRTGFDITNAIFKGKRRDDGKIDMALAGSADLRNTSLKIGTPIAMAKARVQAQINYAPEMPMAASQIKVTAPAMTMIGRNFDTLSVDTTTSGKDTVLQIKKVKAGLYEGNLDVSGTFDTVGQQNFDLSLVLDNARLDPLLTPGKKMDPVNPAPPKDDPAKISPVKDVLNAGGNVIGDIFELGNKAITDVNKAADHATQSVTPDMLKPDPVQPPKDDTPIAPDPRGKPNDARVSAALNVKGLATSIHSYKGKGTLVAKGLDGKAMPAAMAVFHLINLRLPDAESFREMNAKARIDGRIIWLDDIKLASPSMELIGSGAINWKTQAIDFRLTTQAPQALNVPLFTALVNGLRDQIIAIRVDGTFAKPNARLQPLSGVVKVFEGNTTVDDDQPNN